MSINKINSIQTSFQSLKTNAKVGGAIDKILNSAFVQQDIITPLEKLGGFILAQ